jgi:hypothetical protein
LWWGCGEATTRFNPNEKKQLNPNLVTLWQVASRKRGTAKEAAKRKTEKSLYLFRLII